MALRCSDRASLKQHSALPLSCFITKPDWSLTAAALIDSLQTCGRGCLEVRFSLKTTEYLYYNTSLGYTTHNKCYFAEYPLLIEVKGQVSSRMAAEETSLCMLFLL